MVIIQDETRLAREIIISERRAAYDASVKKLLSDKQILAWIMKGCIIEYKDYDIKEIASKFIEGEPETASRGVYPDETNVSEQIQGIRNEDSSRTEGKVTYDIIFNAILPKTSEKVDIIINVEAQNDTSPGYSLIKRAGYYISRMISAQYGPVFQRAHYEDIQKVYSIWICPDAPLNMANNIKQYCIVENSLLGDYKEKRDNYDLMEVYAIYFNKNELNATNKLIGMLQTLLSQKLEVGQKFKVLSEDYGLAMSRNIEREVFDMCNLSMGIYNEGITKGIAEGKVESKAEVAETMLQYNEPITKIIKYSKLPYEKIKEIADRLSIKINTD